MSTSNEKRKDAILLSLKKCDYLTREQLQRMHKLGKLRNAQRVLYEMSDYLSYFTDEKKKVYYLNSAGRERIQAEKIRKKTAMITHYLMRNDLYITLGRPSTWKNEIKVTIADSKVGIVADAAFIMNKVHHFVEVDYKQAMSKNLSKIKRYKELSTFNPQFTLVWVTTSLYRKSKIEDLCKELKCKVYLWEDIK